MRMLVEQLRGKTLIEGLDIVGDLAETAIACGIEIALLDALGKAEGRSVSELLSPAHTVPRNGVFVNTVIGAASIEAAVSAARTAKNHGYGCIKLKVGFGLDITEEIERVAAVREAIGPETHLRL